MEKNKDASSCILFMIARMQSKRSALALLHIWWCRKNIILEKKGLYVWTWLVVHFFFFLFWTMYSNLHLDLWNISFDDEIFRLYGSEQKVVIIKVLPFILVSSRKLVYFISLSALLLYYLPLEYHALYLIIFCFG